MAKRIRFKDDCIKWILEGKKTTTFRATRRNGLYEIVKGGWFHPEGTGIFIQMEPIEYISKVQLIMQHYHTEGDFSSPEEFMSWLKSVGLYDHLPPAGWLNKIELESR